MQVHPQDMINFVEARGYSVERIFNTTQVWLDTDVQLRCVGYSLRGPHGTKTVLKIDANGLVDLNAARLWCEGVDRSKQRVQREGAWIGQRKAHLSPSGWHRTGRV